MLFKKTKKKFFSGLFRQRDFMLRERDTVSFCSLSARQQVLLFLILGASVLWSVFTSFYFFRYEDAFSQKTSDFSRLDAEYADLKDEMKAVAGYMDSMIERFDNTERELDSLKREQTAENEHSKVRKVSPALGNSDKNTAETERFREVFLSLKEQTSFIREKIAEMTGESVLFSKKETPSFYKIRLQRDIAVSEMLSLREKVAEQEKLISAMQEAEILAFRKMAAVADNNVKAIENVFLDVGQSLSSAGIGMEALLRRIRRDKENIGIGGPFIPMPMPKPQHDLNISLVSLNQRLDRWYDLITLQDILPLGKPVEHIRVTSAFGSRGDPFQGSPARHEGLDLGGMIGEPVYATAPGKVVRTGNWGWYGNMVEIDHGLGVRTRYAHMEKIFVTKGETVQAGDRIGTLGNTGRSTGPHLHYEIRIRGTAVEPMNFIKAKKNVFKS